MEAASESVFSCLMELLAARQLRTTDAQICLIPDADIEALETLLLPSWNACRSEPPSQTLLNTMVSKQVSAMSDETAPEVSRSPYTDSAAYPARPEARQGNR